MSVYPVQPHATVRDLNVHTVFRLQNLELGKTYDIEEDHKVFKESIKVQDAETGKTLAILLKNVIQDEHLIRAGRRLITFRGVSQRRADASGERKLVHPKSGNTDKVVYHGKSSPSVMLGYEASDNYHPCRLTSLTRKHRETFDHDVVFLVQYISELFKTYCPVEYAKQKEFVDGCNRHMIMPNTVYTSLTVNMTWRTSLHVDKGDFRAGLGNLCCFKYGDYSGGEVMLPNYKIAFDLREGDILFMDVHEPHCNNVLTGEGRVSLICYAREQIKVRCANAKKSDIENPVSFRNRSKRPRGPCVNCRAKESVEWRYTVDCEPLCNPCGLAYKNNNNKMVPRERPSQIARRRKTSQTN
jgi:hypothetical protein